jgi:hypothetical protein
MSIIEKITTQRHINVVPFGSFMVVGKLFDLRCIKIIIRWLFLYIDLSVYKRVIMLVKFMRTVLYKQTYGVK